MKTVNFAERAEGRKKTEVTWISLDENANKDSKRSPKSFCFVEEVDRSLSSEPSSPEITILLQKNSPGTSRRQQSRAKVVPIKMTKQAPIAKKSRGRPKRQFITVESKELLTDVEGYNLRLPRYNLRRPPPVEKPSPLTLKKKATRGRPRKRPEFPPKRGNGHCACCRCTHSQSPSPVRKYPAVRVKMDSSGGEEGLVTHFKNEVKSEYKDVLKSDTKISLNKFKRPIKSDDEDYKENENLDLPKKNVHSGDLDDGACSSAVNTRKMKRIESPEGLSESQDFRGFQLPRLSSVNKKAKSASMMESIYNYKGPLIVLCKDDLGDETLKDYCLFCGELHEDIDQHMLQEHSDQTQVAFVVSRASKLEKKFWKYLGARGNHEHNNLRALQNGIGYIIPVSLNNVRKEISEMKMCSGCNTWMLAGSLHLHKKTCPAELWERSFKLYLEKRFQKGSNDTKDKQGKVQTVLASLFKSSSELILGDQICMTYLAKVCNKPNATAEQVKSLATELTNVILVLKKRFPKSFNMRSAFEQDRIKVLMASIRVVAMDKIRMKMNMNQLQLLSTMMGDLIAVAIEMTEDDEDVDYLEDLKSLVDSDKWLEALAKPIY